jgi:ribonuclease Z
LEIYGPKGIYDYIAMNLAMTGSRIRNLKLVIYELVGGSDVRRAKRQRNASSYQPSSIVGSIAPNINMEQRTIEMGNDGTWTIQTLAVMKEHDVNGRDVHLRVGIKAAEVLHLPGIQTFGYVVEECTPSAKIDAEKAKQLGIAPGLKYRALKNGYSVMSDDGLSEVTPAQVMVDGVGKKRARKFALLGDAWKVPKPMMDLCCGADLLVHEATLEENLHAVTKQRGHSTADMAGRLAMQVKAKILAMNHISGRHDSQDSINELVQSAEKANCKTSDILVAHDFLMVSIPEQYEDNRKGDKQPTGEGQVDVHSL